MSEFYASNRLYNNDVGSLKEAIELHVMALRHEANVMDGICDPDDDFPQRLHSEADKAETLLAELTDHINYALAEIVEKWRVSDNKLAVSFAQCELDGDYSSLAV